MKAHRTTLRLAARLAWGPHPRQRLRALLLGAAAAACAVTVLFAAGVLHALSGEADRLRQRSVVPARGGEEPVVRVDLRADTWGLEQYPVVWLDPVDEGDPAAMPPGMSAWPERGGWAVSPGLAALARAHPALAARFPGAEVLGDAGVLHPGELLAYRHMPEGGAMGAAAFDAAGFGGPGPSIGERTEVDGPALALALTGFVGLPVVLLAAAGTAVSAPLRARRLALLRALGTPARRLRALVAAEAALVFLPGLAVGVLLWEPVAPLLGEVPVVGRPVADGALGPPPWATAAVVAGLACIFAALALVTERRGRGSRHRVAPRPRAGRPRLPVLRTAPAAAGLVLLALAQLRDDQAASTTTLAGVVLLAVGVPPALPAVARTVGGRMADRASGPRGVLAGRRLQYDPRSAVRPLYGVAALLVLAPVVAAWMGAVRHLDAPPPRDPTAEAVVLRGALDRVDTGVLLRGLPGAVAVPLAPQDSGPSGSSGPPVLRVGLGCADAARLLGTAACGASGSLTAEGSRRLAVLLGTPAPLRLVPPGTLHPTPEGELAVIAPREPRFENAIRAAALAHPAALNVVSAADLVLQESELVSWILGGVAVLGSLTFLVLALGTIDRTAAGRGGDRLLGALGLTRGRVRAIGTEEFLLGYAAVVGTGLACGAVASAAWSAMDPAIGYPTGVLAGAAVLAALLAGAGVLGIRLASGRRPEEGRAPG
ncbi:FtsX-like permease family protein [Streptomyces sp. NPDC090029]|uniref:FtsX-like permease family protein n=1 Tax=Streptomyces sp. NPDC090029 TaxID=3365924 RepID=UPI003819AA2B